VESRFCQWILDILQLNTLVSVVSLASIYVISGKGKVEEVVKKGRGV